MLPVLLVALAAIGVLAWLLRDRSRQLDRVLDRSAKERELLLNRIENGPLVQTWEPAEVVELPKHPEQAEIDAAIHGLAELAEGT